jgi:hypothetical protein
MECRERAKYVLDGWEAPRSKAALIFGSLFHWLLEMHGNAIMNGDGGFTEDEFDDLESDWLDENPPAEADNPQGMEEHLAMARALFGAYADHYKKEDEKGINWVELESEFDVDFEGHRLRGKRDGLLRWKKDKKGKLWLLETKTASRIDESTMNEKLGFDFQNLFYTIATEEEVGEKIGGILYNVIRKPQIKNTTGDLQEYYQRMYTDVRKRPEFYFKRFKVNITEKRKKIFRAELELKLSEFFEWAQGEGRHYRNEASCISRWKCEFLSACNSLSMRGFNQTRELFSELDGDG